MLLQRAGREKGRWGEVAVTPKSSYDLASSNFTSAVKD